MSRPSRPSRLEWLVLAILLTVYVANASTAPPHSAALPDHEVPGAKQWVFFTDKGLSSEGARRRAMEELAECYNQRALERRCLRRTAEGLFDERDLPLAPQYLAAIRASGAELVIESRWLNAVSARITGAQLPTIVALPFVRAVEPVQRARLAPNPVGAFPEGAERENRDPAYGYAEAQLEQIGLIALHEAGYTGNGVIIGILDTGFQRDHIAFNHPEHPLTVVAEWDFVNDDGNTGIDTGDPSTQHHHGTLILGTLGAYEPEQFLGGAFDASFVLAKAEDIGSEYPLEEDWFAAGLEFIEARGGDVATSSLIARLYDQWELDGVTSVMTQAFNTATDNGVHCCQGAGNEGHDSDPSTSHLMAPADAFDVLTCGAVDQNGSITYFSSDGPTADGRNKPEVLARGLNTWTVAVDAASGYQTASGTSLSTPLVCAAVACLVQMHPDWTVSEMRERLFATADYFLEHGTYDPLYVHGYGIIDAAGASSDPAVVPPDRSIPAMTRLLHIASPVSRRGSLRYQTPFSGAAELSLFDGQGRLVGHHIGPQRAGGGHTLSFELAELPTGLYYCRLQMGRSVMGRGQFVIIR